VRALAGALVRMRPGISRIPGERGRRPGRTLHAPVQVLYSRLRARARPFEACVDVSYLSDLQARYDKWVQEYDYSPVLRVDTAEQGFAPGTGAVTRLAARISREVA
jgi:deoxyadenosine/deoxycytidine kinase